MNGKINILDIKIDDYTAKQAMKEIMSYMQSEPVNVIEMVTVDMLMYAKEEPELRESMETLDLVLAGEKEILEAAQITDTRQLQEVETSVFLRMFFRYLHKNRRRVFLLVETEEEVQEFYEFLDTSYSGIQVVGIAKVVSYDRADDKVVNAVNGGEVDCVIAALKAPLQEEFIIKNRSTLNARIWLGMGKAMKPVYKAGNKKSRLLQFVTNRMFRREMEKNKKEMQIQGSK